MKNLIIAFLIVALAACLIRLNKFENPIAVNAMEPGYIHGAHCMDMNVF